jgi:glycine oxidase
VKTYDAIVVGGGIIGASLAFELANRKLSVLILDRQEPGQEASWAAAGMLGPEPESAEDLAIVLHAKMSLASYPAFIEKIEETSGLKAGFRRDGALKIFFGPNGPSERDRATAAHRQAGLATSSITISEARAIEPSIATGASAAAWLPDECSVDPRALTSAVLAACTKGGVEIRAGIAAEQIFEKDGRCEGVIAGGEKLHSKHIIVAAGCFSAGVNGVGQYAPTSPVRGQIVALLPAQGGLKCVLRSERGYVVPRNDGRIIAGSTSEHVGFEKKTTTDGIQQILNAAIELAPVLANATIADAWSGLRPDTPDHLPILGPAEPEGLWIATGHYRNGILLAPGTAKVMADWIVDGKSSLALEQFSPRRFAVGQRSAAR